MPAGALHTCTCTCSHTVRKEGTHDLFFSFFPDTFRKGAARPGNGNLHTLEPFQPSGKETIYRRPRAATVGHKVCHLKRVKKQFFSSFLRSVCAKEGSHGTIAAVSEGRENLHHLVGGVKKKARHRHVSEDPSRSAACVCCEGGATREPLTNE